MHTWEEVEEKESEKEEECLRWFHGRLWKKDALICWKRCKMELEIMHDLNLMKIEGKEE